MIWLELRYDNNNWGPKCIIGSTYWVQRSPECIIWCPKCIICCAMGLRRYYMGSQMYHMLCNGAPKVLYGVPNVIYGMQRGPECITWGLKCIIWGARNVRSVACPAGEAGDQRKIWLRSPRLHECAAAVRFVHLTDKCCRRRIKINRYLLFAKFAVHPLNWLFGMCGWQWNGCWETHHIEATPIFSGQQQIVPQFKLCQDKGNNLSYWGSQC